MGELIVENDIDIGNDDYIFNEKSGRPRLETQKRGKELLDVMDRVAGQTWTNKEFRCLQDVTGFLDNFALCLAENKLPKQVYSTLKSKSLSYTKVYNLRQFVSSLTSSKTDKTLTFNPFKMGKESKCWMICFLLRNREHIFVSISESKQNSFKEYQQNFINDTKVLSHWTTHLYQYSVPFIALGIDITASSLESTSKAIERALQYHVITNVIKFNYDNKKKVQIEYVSKYPFRLLNARLSAPKVKAYKKWKDDDQKANNRKDALASPFTGLRSKERVLKTIDEALAMNNNRYGSFIATKKNIKAKKNTFKTISASPSRSTSKSKSPDINNNKTAETKEDDMEYWPATEMWSTRLKFAKLAELKLNQNLIICL